MFALAERAGELDVDRLEDEMPLRLALEWGEYLRWKNGDGKRGKMIRDPDEAWKVAVQRWGNR